MEWEGIIGMYFGRLSVHLSVCLFVCLSVTFYIQAITLYLDELPYNLVQMLSSLRRCPVTLTQVHTSKVKVHMHVSEL